MKRRILVLLAAVGVGVSTGLLGGIAIGEQKMSDYASTPPFVFQAAIPNILLLLDNSASMNARVIGDHACENEFGANPAPNACFSPETTYAGYLDPLSCYVYEDNDTSVNNIGNERFSFSFKRATISALCPNPGEWDGNLLNFIMFRRLDALKKAMIGGICSPALSLAQLSGNVPDARDTNGNCPPIGSDPKVTLQNHRDSGFTFEHIILYRDGNPVNSGYDGYIGRVPDSVSKLPAGDYVPKLYIGLQSANTNGFMCVDDDNSGDANSRCDLEVQFVQNAVITPEVPAHDDVQLLCPVQATPEGCPVQEVPTTVHHDAVPAHFDFHAEVVPDSDAFVERQLNLRWVAHPEPKGVIQQVGAKARFGMMEFKPDSLAADGGALKVGIGLLIELSTNAVWSTNAAAMVHAVQAVRATTQTPLAETLYEAVRYVAQLNSLTGAYETAFESPGGSDTCPSDPAFGYGNNNACSRDPYFHGSAWASPPAVVPCCQTFIVLVTDGAPTLDEQIPESLKEYAAPVHGTHCAGASCHTADGTPAAILLKEHKTDHDHAGHFLDDVALWAHTVDLRQEVIPFGRNGETITGGHHLNGAQNVTLYTFYAFGDISGRELLMQAARQGGFVDSTPTGQSTGNSLPDLTGPSCAEPGAGTSGIGVSNPEWDRVNNRTGLTEPDCIPDNYFESGNVDEIQERLLATLYSILRRSSSGTSVASQTTSTTGQGAAYQAYFFPSTKGTSDDVTWTGFTQALFVDQFGNLREDTDKDGNLVLTKDKIVVVRFDTSLVPPATVVDKYTDAGGTGVVDPTKKEEGLALSTIEPVWEAGRRLALTDPGDACNAGDGGIICRRILTWVDKNNDGLKQQAEEWLEFKADDTSAVVLCPFLGGDNVADCKAGGALGTASVDEAKRIINFIRGTQVSGLRDRQVQVKGDDGVLVNKVWKLGDVMDATPVVVGAPRERYDVIYGDTTYAEYFALYKDRRQMIYVGANDGMLHAFNAGFLRSHDDPTTTDKREELSFCTVASVSDCHSTAGLQLGAEKWAYIPHDLLPQLRWLIRPDYSHVYYVDLKPKVTDVRIFCTTLGVQPAGCITGQNTSHPNGWGTILIGGLRMGGSCGNCPATKGGPRIVTANFDGTTQTRMFLSSYFVMDITDPEQEPVLLWTFRDQNLGFTTAAPAVFRVNNVGGTSSLQEQWHVVFGTGPTHYDGSSTQLAQIFTVDLKLGPTYGPGGVNVNRTTGTVGGKNCSTTNPCIVVDSGPGQSAQAFFPSTGIFVGFMGDAVTLDVDLDYRVDVVYAGSVSCNGPTPSPCSGSNPIWKGAMWRLTLNGGALDPETWGAFADGGPRAYTPLISAFGAPLLSVGPVAAAPAITTDDDHNLWVYFGTGRFFANQDNITTDPQHLFGVKDMFITQGSPGQNTESNDLLDVTDVKICVENCGAPGSGLEPVLTSLQNKAGWVVRLKAEPRERSLGSPVVFGGLVFFTSFTPPEDICGQGGNSRLYAMFFRSGTGTPQGVLGTTTDASKEIAKTVGVSTPGISFTPEVHFGQPKPDGSVVCLISGLGHGDMAKTCLTGLMPRPVTSRMITWRDI